MVAIYAMILALLVASCTGLERAEPSCELARVHVLDGLEHMHESWPRAALREAYHRVGDDLACRAMRSAEIWVYVHDEEPVGCAGRSPYQSCALRVRANVYHVEVGMRAVRTGAASSTYEVLAHEMLHVLLRRLGVPGAEHHALMSSWLIDTTSRRSHEYE